MESLDLEYFKQVMSQGHSAKCVNKLAKTKRVNPILRASIKEGFINLFPFFRSCRNVIRDHKRL